MKHLKLFEAHSSVEYQKALNKIKSLINDNKSKEEILSYIDSYSSDDTKGLDELRKMLNRIQKKYNNFAKFFIYNIKGDNYQVAPYKRYYCFDEENKKELVEFLYNQDTKYAQIIDSISSNKSIIEIEKVFNKLFEILDWVNKSGTIKYEIEKRQPNLTRGIGGDEYKNLVNIERNKKITDIDSLNNSNMGSDNEYLEVNNLVRNGKIYIQNIINSL